MMIVSRETRRHVYQVLVCGILLLMSQGCLAQAQKQTKTFIVAISQIVDHPSLDDVRQGFFDFLQEQGYEDGKNLRVLYRNAQGNIATSSQIAYSLMEHDPLPDVFVAIGTPTAQSAISAGRKNKIPVIFAAVTDPVSSKLVSDLNNHDPRITGVIDFPPLQQQFNLIEQICPHLEKIGVIYNSGESNSVSVIEKFTTEAKKRRIQVVKAVVGKATDLTLVFRHLHAEGTKAIYIPQDNTVILAAAMVAQLSYATKIPVFTSDNGSVKKGALASQSYHYYDVGQKAGDYALKIFKGVKPADLAIAPPETHSVYVNMDAAKRLDITIPQKLLDIAHIYPQKKHQKVL